MASVTDVSGATEENRFYSIWTTVLEIGPKFRISSKQKQLVVAWVLRASVCKCGKGHLAATIDILLPPPPPRHEAKETGQEKSFCDCQLVILKISSITKQSVLRKS